LLGRDGVLEKEERHCRGGWLRFCVGGRTVTRTTIENLVTLLDAWTGFAHKPIDLVFAKTLYHDLQILSDIINEAIASRRGLERWQKNLVADLHAFLNAPNYEASFVQSYYPNLRAQMVAASTLDSSRKYDLNKLDQAIQGVIGAIRSSTYLTNLHSELTSTVNSPSPDAREKIEALIRILLVPLVEMAAPKTLEEHATTAISKSFLSLHKTELEAALRVTHVQQSLTQFVEALSLSLDLFVQAIASVANGPKEERAKDLSNYLLTSHREFSAQVNLFFIQEMFDGVVFPPNVVDELIDASTEEKEEQSEFVENSLQTDFWISVANRWFEDFCEQAIRFFARLHVNSSNPRRKNGGSGEDWIKEYGQRITQLHAYWEAYCNQAVESLLSPGLFQDWESPIPDWVREKIPVFRMTPSGRVRDPDGWGSTQHHSAKQRLKDIVNGTFAFTLGMAFGANSSVNLDSSQISQMKYKLVRVMLEEILQYLTFAVQQGEADPSNPSGGDVVRVLNRLQAQRRITEILVEWLRSFCELFLSSSHLFNSDATATFLKASTAAIVEAFNGYLVDQIIKSFKKTDVNFLVNQVQDSEIDQILADLILKFAHPPSEYRVVGIVDGLDLKGGNLTMGQVQLYDARVWDYGEANLLDGFDLPAYRGNVERYAPAAQTALAQILSSSYEYRGRYGVISNQLVRHSGRATTTVQAYDPKMAQELATIEMSRTLDILTWCYTGRKNTDIGSKFEMLPFYVVINTAARSFNQLTARDSPMLTLLDAQDKNLAKFAQSYDTLLSQPETARTQVEQATIRSLHWLAKGYWETYQADQFLNYWIALEQLLVETRRGKIQAVKRRLPSLASTWDRTELGQQVLSSCRELIEEIQTHQDIQTQLDANPSFSNWQTSRLVLLQNLILLEQIDTAQKLTHLPKLRAMLDPNKITDAKNELQEKMRYQISLFNRRRNLIVHEGYSYSPDMTYYTEALWEFARFACTSVAGRVCANVGQFQTIDDVIATYDTPW